MDDYCETCERTEGDLEPLGTCLVDVVPRFDDLPRRVLCLPCMNAAAWHQGEAAG